MTAATGTSRPDAPPRPLPQPTPVSAPFWEACARGELLYQRCGDCGTAVFPPQEFCPRDLGTRLDWQASSGRGRIYSYSVVHRPQTPAFAVPYTVVIVELEEGYTMMSSLVGCPPDEVRIGLPVTVTFEPLSPEIHLPCFTPAVTEAHP